MNIVIMKICKDAFLKNLLIMFQGKNMFRRDS